MAYADEAYAIALYGSDTITIHCDRDKDGTLDSSAFATQLEIAAEQIDMYLLGRYTLPLASPPAHLKKINVDIALYNGAPTPAVITEEIKERYKNGIRMLELIAANKVKLKIDTDETEQNASQQSQTATKSAITISNDDRQMRRDDLQDLL